MFIFYSITRVVCISQAKIVFYLTQLEAELAFTILEKGFLRNVECHILHNIVCSTQC